MESQEQILRPGDRLQVRVLKSDGTLYRHWQTTVESASASEIVTVDRIGQRVGGAGGGWHMKYTSRTTYWLNRRFNLGELYERTGQLKQIYIHIASAATISPNALKYTDYELDVVKRQGEPPFVRDEDEFMEARLQYGYSEELCEVCRDAVVRAIELASSWRPSGPPRFGRRSALPRD